MPRPPVKEWLPWMNLGSLTWQVLVVSQLYRLLVPISPCSLGRWRLGEKEWFPIDKKSRCRCYLRTPSRQETRKPIDKKLADKKSQFIPRKLMVVWRSCSPKKVVSKKSGPRKSSKKTTKAPKPEAGKGLVLSAERQFSKKVCWEKDKTKALQTGSPKLISRFTHFTTTLEVVKFGQKGRNDERKVNCRLRQRQQSRKRPKPPHSL